MLYLKVFVISKYVSLSGIYAQRRRWFLWGMTGSNAMSSGWPKSLCSLHKFNSLYSCAVCTYNSDYRKGMSKKLWAWVDNEGNKKKENTNESFFSCLFHELKKNLTNDYTVVDLHIK